MGPGDEFARRCRGLVASMTREHGSEAVGQPPPAGNQPTAGGGWPTRNQRSKGGRGMRDAGSVIRVEGLVKRYRGQVAVDGLSIAVPEGSVFGLLGENGAGKTTTILALLGLIQPEAG